MSKPSHDADFQVYDLQTKSESKAPNEIKDLFRSLVSMDGAVSMKYGNVTGSMEISTQPPCNKAATPVFHLTSVVERVFAMIGGANQSLVTFFACEGAYVEICILRKHKYLHMIRIALDAKLLLQGVTERTTDLMVEARKFECTNWTEQDDANLCLLGYALHTHGETWEDGIQAAKLFVLGLKTRTVSMCTQQLVEFDLVMFANYRECNQQYGKSFGCQIALGGANQAEFAVRSGSWQLVSSVMKRFPVLAWGENLFILACSLKHLELVRNWQSLSEIEYYGWVYGLQNALIGGSSPLISWFEGNLPKTNSDVMESVEALKHAKEDKYRTWAETFIGKNEVQVCHLSATKQQVSAADPLYLALFYELSKAYGIRKMEFGCSSADYEETTTMTTTTMKLENVIEIDVCEAAKIKTKLTQIIQKVGECDGQNWKINLFLEVDPNCPAIVEFTRKDGFNLALALVSSTATKELAIIGCACSTQKMKFPSGV